MEAFDDGPLQLAYQVTLDCKPDPGAGHCKPMVIQSRMEVVGTESTTRIGGSHNVTVGKAMVHEVGGDTTLRTGKDSFTTVGGSCLFHVRDQIEFRCGASTFTMKSDGTIDLSGVTITISGKSQIMAKARNIDLK